MNIIKQNPEFNDDGVSEEIPESEEVKEEEETQLPDGEETPPEPSEEKKPAEEKEVDVEAAKNAIRRDESKIDEDLKNLDKEIELARQRITQKRQERREKRELLQKLPEDDTPVDDLSDVDPDSLALIERVVKSRGYVSKSELDRMSFESAHKNAEKEFFQKHPEYSPENDADDTLYNALLEELGLFAKPKNANEVSVLFEKAHKLVATRFSDRFSGVKKEIKKAINSEARVEKQTIGGGNSGGSAIGKKSTGGYTPEQIQRLKAMGWSDADINEINQ